MMFDGDFDGMETKTVPVTQKQADRRSFMHDFHSKESTKSKAGITDGFSFFDFGSFEFDKLSFSSKNKTSFPTNKNSKESSVDSSQYSSSGNSSEVNVDYPESDEYYDSSNQSRSYEDYSEEDYVNSESREKDGGSKEIGKKDSFEDFPFDFSGINLLADFPKF